MKRKIRLVIISVFSFSLLISMILPVFSQIQQNALIAIQQADEKLTYTLSLLEEFGDSTDIRDLVISTDEARYLISKAKEEYNETNYTSAYEDAMDANEQLDAIINQIELIQDKKQQNNIFLFSLLGVFSAIFTVLFIFIFIRNIYPWYLEKRIEEYEKLEIKYDKYKVESKK